MENSLTQYKRRAKLEEELINWGELIDTRYLLTWTTDGNKLYPCGLNKEFCS